MVVDGVRTPFVKAYTSFAELTALDLSRIATSELVARVGIDAEEIDEVIMGTVLPSPHAPNLAREVVLSADLPRKIPGYTLGRACASSAQRVRVRGPNERWSRATSHASTVASAM